MTECWVNVYEYINSYGVHHIFLGKDEFQSREAAINYIPSMPLRVAYRIHVRLRSGQ